MIIIEGTDLVGKTTLAQALLKALPGYTYQHMPPLPEGFNGYYGYLELLRRRCVMDRFVLSELVYRSVDGKDVAIAPAHYRLLEAQMTLAGCFTVVITTTTELLAERWTPSELFSLDVISQVNDAYIRMCRNRNVGAYDVNCVNTRLHCHGMNPYPTDDNVKDIVRAYQYHLDVLDGLNARRPCYV